MTTHRAERVADVVRDILARVVREQVRDPRVGFVTITEVRVSADLRHARVFVSSLNDEERDHAVDALNHAAGFLRRELAREARLRRVPELRFQPDAAMEQGRRVEDLVREIRKSRGEENDPGGGERDGG